MGRKWDWFGRLADGLSVSQFIWSSISIGTLSVAGQYWTWLAQYGWGAVIFAAVGATAALMLCFAATLAALRYFRSPYVPKSPPVPWKQRKLKNNDPRKWAGTYYDGMDNRDRFSQLEVTCYWAEIPLVASSSDLKPWIHRRYLMSLCDGVREGILTYHDVDGNQVPAESGRSDHDHLRSELERFFEMKGQRPPFLYPEERSL